MLALRALDAPITSHPKATCPRYWPYGPKDADRKMLYSTLRTSDTARRTAICTNGLAAHRSPEGNLLERSWPRLQVTRRQPVLADPGVAPLDEDDVDPEVAHDADDEPEAEVDEGATEGHVERETTSRDEADAGSENEEDATPWTEGGETLRGGATTYRKRGSPAAASVRFPIAHAKEVRRATQYCNVSGRPLHGCGCPCPLNPGVGLTGLSAPEC